MPVTVQLELPESLLSMMQGTPETFADELRLAAAVKWFETGRVSHGKAAELAGLSREEFQEALALYDVASMGMSPDDLRRDVRSL